MKPDFIKVKYNDETILTVDSQALADNFVRCMLSFDSEMTNVTVTYEDNTKRKAKKFILSKREAMTIPNIGLSFLFPKNTIIYIFNS